MFLIGYLKINIIFHACIIHVLSGYLLNFIETYTISPVNTKKVLSIKNAKANNIKSRVFRVSEVRRFAGK